jgi:tRNA-dihydrouridine synthase A
MSRFSVAPMMDWTDRHCRYFHRLLTKHTALYTEMITTGALLHGDLARHMKFDATEQPLVLQLGGSEPADLAHCTKLAQSWGYRAINLNCGCPSERVQRGAFGACLMAEPKLVRDCVAAMRAAADLPVSVKHRIGIDRNESYEFVRDFIATVADGGANEFIVHARSAWLQGLSPKQNREVPPLRYELVYQLKRDFPQLIIVINGGITDIAQAQRHLTEVDGVMVGRTAYHEPWVLTQVDEQLFGAKASLLERHQIVIELVRYAQRMVKQGVPLRAITRHVLGLFNGVPGARLWRQRLSDAALLRANDPQLLLSAASLVSSAALPSATRPLLRPPSAVAKAA